MKFKLQEAQQQAKEAESWVRPQPCLVCSKVIAGAYGAWHEGWTCSLACEATYQKEKTCNALTAMQAFEQKTATSPPI